MMNDIFERDLNGEMVSPKDSGYDELINSIWDTMKTAAELNDGYHTPDEVWIGINATILSDVKIGYVFIGANSVVTKDVPPITVVAGNPAKAIKTLEKPLIR